MKLGIEGKWALVCAASKGLGKGCAKALVMEGVNVVITARGAETLEATAAELRGLNPNVTVVTVAGDITTPEDRAAALAAAPKIHILINNAGGPPPMIANWAKRDGKTYEESAEVRAKTVPARRFGTADEFGATCAFLCSEHAGYITGQNILMDGGSYPGTF